MFTLGAERLNGTRLDDLLTSELHKDRDLMGVISKKGKLLPYEPQNGGW